MDLEELKKCENEDVFSKLIMQDLLKGYNDRSVFPDHRLIAVVDHEEHYSIEKIKSFFDKVRRELEVKFRVGDATTIIISGKKFHRYFLYSDEEPLKKILYPDGVFRLQEPMVERTDGMRIDPKKLCITFRDHGEVLNYSSIDDLQKAVLRILDEYWPGPDHPDIAITDSISEYPVTKWMVESFSDFMITMASSNDQIRLAERIGKHVPDLKFDLRPDQYVPLAAALQLAAHMNGFDPGIQDEIINRLVLNFGFFDDYSPPVDYS